MSGSINRVRIQRWIVQGETIFLKELCVFAMTALNTTVKIENVQNEVWILKKSRVWDFHRSRPVKTRISRGQKCREDKNASSVSSGAQITQFISASLPGKNTRQRTFYLGFPSGLGNSDFCHVLCPGKVSLLTCSSLTSTSGGTTTSTTNSINSIVLRVYIHVFSTHPLVIDTIAWQSLTVVLCRIHRNCLCTKICNGHGPILGVSKKGRKLKI